MLKVVRDAAIVAALAAAVALGFNAVRPNGIPFVATAGYEIFVPCPEPLGEVTVIEPGDARLSAERTLVIDARDAAAFAAWHHPRARHVAFDYLDPVADATVRDVASSGAAAVVVYGDGADPDSGHELARELSGRGVRNVFSVQGGAPALRAGKATP